MSFGTNSLSGGTQGSASMGTLTGLNRLIVAVPANVTITSFRMTFQLTLGASGTTYTSYAAGTEARGPTMVAAIGYIPTGGTAPNIATNPDDPQVLDLDQCDGYEDRNTINQAGAPAYADTYTWGGRVAGRIQQGSGAGGQLLFLLGNTSGVTQVTGWTVVGRATYQ